MLFHRSLAASKDLSERRSPRENIQRFAPHFLDFSKVADLRATSSQIMVFFFQRLKREIVAKVTKRVSVLNRLICNFLYKFMRNSFWGQEKSN